MNEMSKTITFAGVAVLAMAVAVIARPRLPEPDLSSPVGTTLNKVDDPLRATHLKIVEFDADSSSLRPFEVDKVGGRWVIPSHSSYPADAEQQMADAATSVMNLDILGVVSNSAGDHETYGVIEPNAQKLEVGATGVGTLVTMEDQDGKAMVNMVIGKEVKDQTEQRYVREVGRDTVYLVKLDTGNLKTEFGDWIEKDLLKLSPFDIRQIQLTKDNVVGARSNVGVIPVRQQQGLMEFKTDDSGSNWEVVRIAESAGEQSLELKDVEIPADQVLDDAKFTELKTALDDLKIVDVEKKPAGLSADLKADKNFAENREMLENLGSRGFVPVVSDKGKIEIVSAQGELICRMKDGVEYLLRFGDLVLGDQKNAAAAAGQSKTAINRYLFVTARVNKDMIKQPELAEVPPAPAGQEPAEKASETEKPAADQPPAEEPAASEPVDEPASEANGDSGPEGDAGAEGESEAGDTKTEPAVEEKPALETPADTAKEPTEEEKAAEKAKQARQKVMDDNARKQKEYDDQVKKAEESVKELNERFADWYYVVSDDVYKKVILERKDVLKAKEAEDKDGAAANPGGGLDGLGGLSPLAEEGLKDLKPDDELETEPAPEAEEAEENDSPEPAAEPQAEVEEPATSQ